MLSEKVNKLATIKLHEMNEISMNIAKELVKEGFDITSLADVEIHIMDLAKDRMIQLGNKLQTIEDLTLLSALVVEISLYLGINIGRKS